MGEIDAAHFLLSLALGYGVAYFFTHISNQWQRFGAVIASLLVFVQFTVLFLATNPIVVHSGDSKIAIVYALGFIIGMIKR